jgi:hypothetical protein
VKPLLADRKAPNPLQQTHQASKVIPAQVPPAAELALSSREAKRKTPPKAERRISSMNEAQIMERLRTVVSREDPSELYTKIRKVGQG